jgi:GT2 family glycosyltransferase
MPQLGIFGAKIYYFSQPKRIWYAGTSHIKNTAHFSHLGKGSIDNGQKFNHLVETDYACGCAFFVDTGVFRKIGLFDDNYYLTYEETDLCYRARRAGINSYFVPDAKVWHKVSVSFGGSESALYKYFVTRNKLLWAEKNLPLLERLMVYKAAFKEFFILFRPPRFRVNKSQNILLTNKIKESLLEYKVSFSKKYNDPIRKAKILGLRDYVLRRFGNGSESIKAIGK